MEKIFLDTKLVGEIEGDFYIPSYQRGYRWGKDEVERLLNDIYSNGAKGYCLQPIVVRRNHEQYELIDGQQRLTTLYLIYLYMHNKIGVLFKPPKFSLTYETREKSEEFLKNIDLDKKSENIDYWFICEAYQTISEWFDSNDEDLAILIPDMNRFLGKNVAVIWYEVDESEDAISLFTRLNIGKIPLTSAELVKAMFLSRDINEQMDREKQEEISLQWDNIEKELHHESLWCFLTNMDAASYQTRIDLILDLITKKSEKNSEKYYTFFAVDEMKKSTSLSVIWNRIQHTFLILKDWYEDHELYHKIGYLIASNKMGYWIAPDKMNLQALYELSIDKTKREFKRCLDEAIKQSIKYEKPYEELSYENSADYQNISRLLLLFNVESVRQIDEQAQRFPFDRYKEKASWSLEHIHAQQSKGMGRQEDWKKWLELHLKSLKTVGADETVIEKVEMLLDKEKVERNEFEELQGKVVRELSADSNVEYIHSIANMALLNTRDNAALNNSTFDVKRDEIVKMDKEGKYIPFCTKMVFLKYYTVSEENQIHFWGEADRLAYVDAMNNVLEKYLEKEISIESERQ